MSPTGWSSGPLNARVVRQLDQWAETYGGYVTESSAMYHLEHVGRRVPDAAWISRAAAAHPTKSALARLSILPVAPKFIEEIRSPTDKLDALMQKMREWISDGVLLGLLLDPQNHVGYVYRSNQSDATMVVDGFSDDFLPGFELDLRVLWQAYDEIAARPSG